VAPPDLAADTPVLDVPHPVEIGVLPVVRHEADAAVLDRPDGWLRQGPDFDVPLVGEEGLDDRPRAVAPRYHEFVVIDAFEQPLRLQGGDDLLAGLEAVRADIRNGYELSLAWLVGADRRIRRENVDQPPVGLRGDGVLVPVTQPDLVVVEIVSRGDLYAAGAELRIHVLISDHGDASAGEGQLDHLAEEVLVALIARVHGQGAVAEHGLRAGRGHDKVSGPIGQRIAHVPEMAALLLVEHLQIRHRRVENGVPVHQPLAPKDEALLVESDEHLPHRGGQSFVHGEALIGPVEGGTDPPQLPGDCAAGLASPGPHALDEGLAAVIVAGLASALIRRSTTIWVAIPA